MTVQQQSRPSTGPRPRLLAVLLLLGGLLAVLLAGPASAHARFEGSDPAEGAVLAELPATVVMSYSEAIAPQFVDTAVVPPGGEPVTTTAAADGTDVTIDLGAPELAAAAAEAGTWQVVARVVSADGHPVEHTTTFLLQPAATVPSPATEPTGSTEPAPATQGATATDGSPGTDAATTPDATGSSSSPAPLGDGPVAALGDGLPGWAGVLVVLAVLAAGAATLVAVLRRRPPEA